MAKKPETAGLTQIEMIVPMASLTNDRNVGDKPFVAPKEAERLIEKGFAKAIGAKAATKAE